MPQSWINSFLQGLINATVNLFGGGFVSNLFMSSTEKSLKTTIKALQGVPTPDLSITAYQTLWSDAYAAAMVMVIVMAAVGVVQVAMKRKIVIFGGIARDIFAVYFGGFVLLFLLQRVMAFSTQAGNFFVATLGGSQDPNWYVPLIAFQDALSPGGAVFATGFAWVAAHLLAFEVLLAQYSIYIAAVLLLLVLALWRTAFGALLLRWTVAYLIVCISIKMLMLAFFALAMRVLQYVPIAGTNGATVYSALICVAAISPFVIFFFLVSTVHKVQVASIEGLEILAAGGRTGSLVPREKPSIVRGTADKFGKTASIVDGMATGVAAGAALFGQLEVSAAAIGVAKAAGAARNYVNSKTQNGYTQPYHERAGGFIDKQRARHEARRANAEEGSFGPEPTVGMA